MRRLGRLLRAGNGRCSGRGPPSGGRVPVEGSMADLAYGVLLIAGFAILVLTLRGLDSL
jgi:hypothetical protein